MIRKLMYYMLLCYLITWLCLPAYALPNRGELQIQIKSENGDIPNGEVTLYQVGIPSGDHFLLSSYFGGGLIKREDVYSSALAAWLSELADTKGTSRILDADGSASFSRLPEGLYMIIHTQKDRILPQAKPILVPVPFNGSWNVGVLPASGMIISESPRTGDHYSPVIGAMGIILTVFALGMCIDRFKGK